MTDHRLGLIESYVRLEWHRMHKARRDRAKEQWGAEPGLYRLRMSAISEGMALDSAHALRTLLRIRRAFRVSPKFGAPA